MIAYSGACVAFSIMWQYDTPWYAKVLTAIPVMIIFSYLLFQNSVDIPQTFKCPLVPLIPCVGVLVNIYLITSLPIDAFIRVFVWTIIGLLIYFTYGIRNSVQRFKSSPTPDFIPGDEVISTSLGSVLVAGGKENGLGSTEESQVAEYRFGSASAAFSINGDGPEDHLHQDGTSKVTAKIE